MPAGTVCPVTLPPAKLGDRTSWLGGDEPLPPKLEVEVQEAQDGLTTATAWMEKENAKLLELNFFC